MEVIDEKKAPDRQSSPRDDRTSAGPSSSGSPSGPFAGFNGTEESGEGSESTENSENGGQTPANAADKLDYIMKSGGVISQTNGETIHCLSIIGQIEGHYLLGEGQKATKYEHIIPLLVSIEESDETDGMLMVLNTMGGDVEAGLAIAEMVAGMSKPTVSLVLGGGHSIGVPLAVAADRSFIVPSATMTIHPVRMSGTVVGVPQTYYYFERMQTRIVNFVVQHSHVEEAKFRELLLRTDQIATDVGSIIDGNEAVSIGLIDKVGGVAEALKELREMIANRRASSPPPQSQPADQPEGQPSATTAGQTSDGLQGVPAGNP